MSADESIVLPPSVPELMEVLSKYRKQLAEAASSNEAAVNAVRQQMNTLERNQIGIRAQLALLGTIEKDISAKQDAND